MLGKAIHAQGEQQQQQQQLRAAAALQHACSCWQHIARETHQEFTVSFSGKQELS
jgi:hypothetical protein